MKAEKVHQEKVARTMQKKSNDTGLPDNLKEGVENLSGFFMDGVQVHYNSSQPASQGMACGTANGRQSITYTEIGGMPVNDNAALEHEADENLRQNSFKPFNVTV